MKLTRLTATLLLCFLTSVGAQQNDERDGEFFYGTVREVSGAAFLDAEHTAAARLAKGRRLYGRQTIRCRNRQGRCVIKVEVCDVYLRDVFVVAGKGRRIPSIVCKPSTEELKKFRAAGRNARPGRGDFVFFPFAAGVFRPEMFVIRWNSSARRGKLSLSIEDESGISLWAEQVDEAKGFHDSERLRVALKTAQAGGRLNLRITAQARPQVPPGGYDEIRFGLISETLEDQLNRELVLWETESGVMRHLGRAGSFSAHGLYADSAKELEKALRLSPTEVDLIRMTISAESYALNRRRVAELCRRLRQGATRQEHCSCVNRCE